MNYNEFEIINDKINMMKELYGRELTATEEIDVVLSFYNKFHNFAATIDVDYTDIFDNVQLTAELDELIDYDFDMAKNHALEVL